jgi:hypothetical protein
MSGGSFCKLFPSVSVANANSYTGKHRRMVSQLMGDTGKYVVSDGVFIGDWLRGKGCFCGVIVIDLERNLVILLCKDWGI